MSPSCFMTRAASRTRAGDLIIAVICGVDHARDTEQSTRHKTQLVSQKSPKTQRQITRHKGYSNVTSHQGRQTYPASTQTLREYVTRPSVGTLFSISSRPWYHAPARQKPTASNRVYVKPKPVPESPDYIARKNRHVGVWGVCVHMTWLRKRLNPRSSPRPLEGRQADMPTL